MRRSGDIDAGLFSVFRATFSPDGRYVAFLGSRPEEPSHFAVTIYDSRSWRRVWMLPISTVRPFGDFEGGLAFSPDGQFIAAGIARISVWRLRDGALVNTIDGPYARGDFAAASLQGLTFDPDGRHLAALYSFVFWPQTVMVRTREDGVDLMEQAKRDIQLGKQDFVTREPVVMEFDAHTGAQLFSTKLYASTPNRGNAKAMATIAYTPDGASIVASGAEYPPRGSTAPQQSDVFVAFIRHGSGDLVRSIHNVHADMLTDFAISPKSDTIVTATSTGASVYTGTLATVQNNDNVRTWRMSTGAKLDEFGPIHGPVKAIRVSSDGSRIVSCQRESDTQSVVKVWSIANKALVGSYPPPHHIPEFIICAISPDGHTVVVPESGRLQAGHARPDRLMIITD